MMKTDSDKSETVAEAKSEATLAAPLGSASRDVIKSTLPKLENRELAKQLLARFPGADFGEILEDMVAECFCAMRWGNKREERQACDFLNEIQRIAIRNAKKMPNDRISDPAKRRVN